MPRAHSIHIVFDTFLDDIAAAFTVKKEAEAYMRMNVGQSLTMITVPDGGRDWAVRAEALR